MKHQETSRRDFLKSTGSIAAATALAGMVVPHVHAAENNTLQVALVGCGGRGTGAAANALSVKQCPVKLVAMADVFDNCMNASYDNLKKQFADQVDVPKERQFLGFDANKKAMDCLKPGDVVILTTPLAFRAPHFEYAIKKGLHVFMEKPLTADGPNSRRMIKLGDEASAKKLKVGVGLMSRHSRPLQELQKRVTDGEIGDILLMRAYRMTGPIGSAFSEKWPGEPSELLWQIRRFHSFIWASGGCFNDFFIHVIDHCCWMKNAWPVTCQAIGGRHYRGKCIDQNFDNYSVEYIFADGGRLLLDGRNVAGCKEIYNSYLHGTKGSAIASKAGDCGHPSATFKGQNPDAAQLLWQSKIARNQTNPYQNEWDDMVEAILKDTPYNEVKRGVEASVVSNMGRKAAHTGQEVTFEAMLNCDQDLAPDIDNFTMDSAAPVKADAEGKYPIPMPGIVTDREY